MELPDPEGLEERRQAHKREQFGRRLAQAVLTVALYVNLLGGAVGAIAYGFGLVGSVSIALLLGGLPLGGIVLVNRYVLRHHRVAAEAVRATLGIRARDNSWTRLLFIGLVSVFPVACTWRWGWDSAMFAAAAFVSLGVVGPVFRKLDAPDLPVWALVLMGAWSVSAGISVLLVLPWFGDGGEIVVGAGWLALMPMGLPAFLVRNRLVVWSRREDWTGGLARAWSVFLPPAQSARLQRDAGEIERALASLKQALRTAQRPKVFAETLLELGETLLALSDPAAGAVFAAAARILPADPRPFLGLAKVVRESDPHRARAYERFAGENAARQFLAA